MKRIQSALNIQIQTPTHSPVPKRTNKKNQTVKSTHISLTKDTQYQLSQKQSVNQSPIHQKNSSIHSSTTQLTNQTINNTLLLQRKLLNNNHQTSISLDILKQLFQIRCADMKLKINPDQLLRFLNKIHDQSSQGNLNLQSLSLTPNCLPIISQIILQESITTLDLSTNNLQSDVSSLIQTINQTSLVSLTLSNCNIGPQGLAQLFKTLQRNIYLVHLNVGNPHSNYRNRLGIQGTLALKKYIMNNKLLQMLNLKACGLNEKMLYVLNDAFRDNDNLISLNISDNELTLLKNDSLVVPQSLLSLDISNNKMGSMGVNNIASQLKPQGGAIEVEYLNLADNKISLLGLQQIMNHLERNLYLKKLILDNNLLTGEMPGFFISFLYSNTILTTLSLKNCSVTAHIMQSISQGLHKNNKLQSLILSKNPITDVGILELKQTFETVFTGLQVLKLKRCSITDESGKPLFLSLQRQNNLNYLDFSQNLLSDNTAFVAIKVIQGNKKIYEFRLKKNLISFLIANEIDNLIYENQQLRKSKLIPELQNQINKISDLDGQARRLDENKQFVHNRKNQIQYEYSSVKESFTINKEQALEKSRLVEERCQKIIIESDKLTKTMIQNDRKYWEQNQQLDEQVNKISQQVKEENHKNGELQKELDELNKKTKAEKMHYRQILDNLKLQYDSEVRKQKISNAEYYSFRKQLELIREQLESREKMLHQEIKQQNRKTPLDKKIKN